MSAGSPEGLKPGVPMGASARASQNHARALVMSLNSAVRALRLYPVENAAVHRAVNVLGKAAALLLQMEGECVLRRVGDVLFVNETRLRLSLDNYAAVASLLALLREAGIGGVALTGEPQSRAWVVLLSFLNSPPSDRPEEDRLDALLERLEETGIIDFELSRPLEEGAGGIGGEAGGPGGGTREAAGDRISSGGAGGADGDGQPADDARERTRQTYMRSLDVTREMIGSARLGRGLVLRKAKRAIQGIVDSILAGEASLMGLTTLRDFDEYTFVHSVNVCILSVALGRRLGLTRMQLLDLGLAALLFDLGKSRVPIDILNKRDELSESERLVLQTHTWQGVLAMFTMPGVTIRPWRAMTAAYEHHMRTDLSGYPRSIRPRTLSLFSKIIAVSDGFDAATTSRVFRMAPWTPADVLQGMRDNPRLGFDPVVVKAFINLTGIYPVGTIVVLDTFEIALVMATSQDPAALSRPLVRIMVDQRGNPAEDSTLVDLSARTASGQYERSIIRTEDPHRHGIVISDYFA